MTQNIIDKVKSSKRILKTQEKKSIEKKNNEILVISTYGKDEPLINIMKGAEDAKTLIIYKYVKNTCPSLRNQLCKTKHICLGPQFGTTKPCNRPRCSNCQIMSNQSSIVGNKIKKKIYN